LEKVSHYEYSIAKAKEEFGLSGAQPFETTIYYPDSYQNTGKASLVVADALKEVGITLNVREIPLDQWLSEVGNGEQGIAWMIYFPTTAEPAEIASWLLDGTGPWYNPANFTDEYIAGLIYGVLSAPAEDGIDDLIEAHSLAQAAAYYAPIWWGESAIAWGSRITVSDFNSYTLLSKNWTQQFKFK
jgi:peptide/nickel transport system substrate-binding protein